MLATVRRLKTEGIGVLLVEQNVGAALEVACAPAVAPLQALARRLAPDLEPWLAAHLTLVPAAQGGRLTPKPLASAIAPAVANGNGMSRTQLAGRPRFFAVATSLSISASSASVSVRILVSRAALGMARI